MDENNSGNSLVWVLGVAFGVFIILFSGGFLFFWFVIVPVGAVIFALFILYASVKDKRIERQEEIDRDRQSR